MTDYVLMFKVGDNWMYLNPNLKLTGSKFKAKTWKKSDSVTEFFFNKNLDVRYSSYEWMVSEK